MHKLQSCYQVSLGTDGVSQSKVWTFKLAAHWANRKRLPVRGLPYVVVTLPPLLVMPLLFSATAADVALQPPAFPPLYAPSPPTKTPRRSRSFKTDMQHQRCKSHLKLTCMLRSGKVSWVIILKCLNDWNVMFGAKFLSLELTDHRCQGV